MACVNDMDIYKLEGLKALCGGLQFSAVKTVNFGEADNLGLDSLSCITNLVKASGSTIEGVYLDYGMVHD